MVSPVLENTTTVPSCDTCPKANVAKIEDILCCKTRFGTAAIEARAQMQW